MKTKLFTILIISSLNSQSIVTDTLSYSNIVNDSFDLFLGEIALVVHKMPVAGKITAINIPIASWGDSSGRLEIQMYDLNYPLNSSGNQYDSTLVDENGWLGYYPHSSNDSIILPHYQWGSNELFWNTFGDSGVCTGIPPVSNSYPPLLLLTWYGSFAPATIDPVNNSVGDNWLQAQDYNWEPELEQGEYIGIFIKYHSGNNNSQTTFFAGNNTGFNDPWRFLLFSPQCSGPSGEGGWHIRSETVNVELAVEYEQAGIDDKSDIPVLFDLHQNYPNPFNPVTTISYELQTSAFVNLSIYNINGQLVETVENKVKSPGYHVVTWNANSVGAGVYFYRIRAGEYSAIKKCILLK